MEADSLHVIFRKGRHAHVRLGALMRRERFCGGRGPGTTPMCGRMVEGVEVILYSTRRFGMIPKVIRSRHAASGDWLDVVGN